MILERLFGDVNPLVLGVLERALGGAELTVDDAVLLLETEGADLQALM